MPANELRQALTTAELVELRKRNEQRAAMAAQRLGARYALHPANRVRPGAGQ